MTLFDEFPAIATAEWEQAVGNAAGQVWRTDSGIDVRPYYRREDLRGLEYLLQAAPGQFPYTRGTRADNRWGIREEIDAVECVEANAFAHSALKAGAEEICFRRAVPQTRREMDTLLEGLEETPVHFWPDTGAAQLARLLLDSEVTLKGSISLHPFDDAEIIAECLKRWRGKMFRPAAIRRASFLEAGATSVQQLGFMLAAGIEYLRWMIGRGTTIDEAAGGVVFGLFAGSSYFFQIARLRAFRLLWARAVESFGGSREAAKAYLFARTADWNQSIYDSYNNALRGTTEAMAAAMGGVDSLAVAPFDETYRNPSEGSRRLARNTQLILKNEVALDRIVDPGAGSYYIEVLTDSLARSAWQLMQDVEAAGGYLAARDSGMIPEQVREARQKKEDALALRRRTITGTNNYPNLKERMLEQMEPKDVELRYGRLAEPFENIRLRTERHAAAGHRTPVFLAAEMGDLKMRTARSNFVVNFLGCGGFKVVTEAFAEAGAVAARARELGVDAVVLCSSDANYGALLAPLVAALKPVPVIIAGNPKDAAELRQDGAADFVHAKSNALDTLANWQERLGVKG